MRFLWLLVAPIMTRHRVDGFSSDTTTTFRRRSPFAERDRSNAATFAISQRAPTRASSTRGARPDGDDEQRGRRSRVAKVELDTDDPPSSSSTAAAARRSGRPLFPRVVRVLASLAWGASWSSWAVSAAAAADDASATTYAALLKRYFPGSIPSTTVKLRAVATLRGKERGYFPYNTGLATCLDPDEVGSSPSSVATRLRLALGNAKDGGEYRLGGVGGLPFAGTAGVRDLLRHASPKTVLLFGPVVGVGGGDVGDGGNCRVGALRRVNRDGVDDAPGVIVRAYRSLSDGGKTSGKTSGGGGGGDDFSAQEDYVVQKLLKRLPLDEYRKRDGGGGGGGGDDVALVEIARELHRTTASFLFREIERALTSGDDHPNVEEVTLLGGIVVARDHGNGAEGGDDWFQPLTARAYGRGGKVTDLYPEIFGDLDVPDGLRS